MYRALIALALSLLMPTALAALADAPPAPSAIELAASVAACMHEGRSYPTTDGLEGVYVEGTVGAANLTEGAELFAVIHDPDGDGQMNLEPQLGSSLRGPTWARERERYAIDCFGRALTAMAPTTR